METVCNSDQVKSRPSILQINSVLHQLVKLVEPVTGDNAMAFLELKHPTALVGSTEAADAYFKQILLDVLIPLVSNEFAEAS